MLINYIDNGMLVAGLDEAGRGCFAGPVFAAAVILPGGYENDVLDDSKKLSEKKRMMLRKEIEEQAMAWAVGVVSNQEIDELNILNASILAMHRAIDGLGIKPGLLLVDGNRFYTYGDILHRCMVKGDATYYCIAAASVLAKTCRDDHMRALHSEYPMYGWEVNKGYPTRDHRDAINRYGITPYHRKSFNMNEQLRFDL
jgi:ribonuclease HII